jgi:hypothetical protein
MDLLAVAWPIYAVFVALATIQVVFMTAAVIGSMILAKSGPCYVFAAFLFMILILGVTLTMRWFALMWMDTNCMAFLIISGLIMIVFELSLITIMYKDGEETPGPLTLPHIVFNIATNVFEVAIVAILLKEKRDRENS